MHNIRYLLNILSKNGFIENVIPVDNIYLSYHPSVNSAIHFRFNNFIFINVNNIPLIFIEILYISLDYGLFWFV